MSATFYIHIGVHKTGTKSIQHTMFDSRAALLARGINYLSIEPTHGPFLISLCSNNPHESLHNIRRHMDTPAKAAAYNAANRQRLTNELSNRCAKFVVSGEGLSIMPEPAVRRLKELFDPYAAGYRVIVYVRDPYEYANSAFLQRVKNGTQLANTAHLPLPNYRSKIEKYFDVFGRENVDIRIFDPGRFAGGDLISDFLTAIGEPGELAGSLKIVRANPSMSHESAMILDEINTAFPAYIGGLANRARASSFHLLLGDIEGEKFCIDPRAYWQRGAEVAADLAWLRQTIGEPVFARSSSLPAASVPRWSDATVDSIRDVVRGMAKTIRELQAAPRPGIWRRLFPVRPNPTLRLRSGKDFSRALSALDEIVLPPELEWLNEAIGRPHQNGQSGRPHFDQATLRALACFMHDLALTIERLKTERA